VPGDHGERLLRPHPADQDRQPGLQRKRRADGVAQPVEAAVVSDPLSGEQAAEQPNRLVEAIEAIAEARSEVDPERLVLALEPAGPDPEDRPTARDVVERRRQLRRQPDVAERVRADQEADLDAVGQRSDGRKRGPTLQLAVGPVALIREEMVVDPDRIPA
jgi:hypothetical protein